MRNCEKCRAKPNDYTHECRECGVCDCDAAPGNYWSPTVDKMSECRICSLFDTLNGQVGELWRRMEELSKEMVKNRSGE